MRFIHYFLFIILCYSSCIDKPKEASSPSLTAQANGTKKENDILNIDSSSGINSKSMNHLQGSSGISTSPSILVRDGILHINLTDGNLTTSSGVNIKIVKDNQIVGTLNLRNAVTDAAINGTTIATNDHILFTPTEPLVPEIVYALVYLDDQTKTQTIEKIFISVANYCNPSLYFSNIPLQKTLPSSNQFVRLPIKENIYLDSILGQVAIIGWDHLSSNNFYFKINDRTPGAKYRVITAYGSYNIPGHECELYYQRDANTPFPTWVDNNYGTKNTKVTWEDTTFHNPISKEYYRFTKTFIVLKVFSSSNVDITSVDTGIISLQQTDSIYGLPVVNMEEESSLLAYLNRGNNNSYSMVLVGLTVGIFAFFLSRRLLVKKEDN